MTYRRLGSFVVLVATLGATPAGAQTPQPFPRPGTTRGVLPPGPSTPNKTPPAGQTAPPAGVQPPGQPVPPAAPAQPAETGVAGGPDESALGVPLYPGATFLASFDAGKGQRYYLYGTSASFLQVVTFYRGSLKAKGELVYEQPPVHAFDIGRFREETMAFPPGVTVKDYTFGGSQGYLHVGPNAQSRRFPTVLQIVPVAVAAAVRR